MANPPDPHPAQNIFIYYGLSLTGWRPEVTVSSCYLLYMQQFNLHVNLRMYVNTYVTQLTEIGRSHVSYYTDFVWYIRYSHHIYTAETHIKTRSVDMRIPYIKIEHWYVNPAHVGRCPTWADRLLHGFCVATYGIRIKYTAETYIKTRSVYIRIPYIRIEYWHVYPAHVDRCPTWADVIPAQFPAMHP